MKKNYMITANHKFELKAGNRFMTTFIMTLVIIFGVVSLSAQTVFKQLYLKSGSLLNRTVPTTISPAQSTVSLTKSTAVAGVSTSGQTANGGNATSLTFTHTTAAAANRLLVVGVASRPAFPVTAVTFNGVALTKLSEIANGIIAKTELWYLINPAASTTANVVVSWTGTVEAAAGATTFTGVNQITPFGTVATNSGTTFPSSLNVPSSLGDLIIDVMGKDGNAPSPGTGQTSIFSVGTNSIKSASSQKAAAAITTNMAWTTSGSIPTWASIGVAVKGIATEAVFTLTPNFCSDFTITSNQNITIKAYYTVTSGTITASPAIQGRLRINGTAFYVNLSPSASATGGVGTTGFITWTGQLASSQVITTANTFDLRILNDDPNVQFTIQFDAIAQMSQITLPTTTYINTASTVVYSAASPGGSIKTNSGVGVTNYLRTVVSDPFGFNDITGLSYSINGGGAIEATSVATSGCTRTYELAFTPATAGSYSIVATAREGTETTVMHSSTITGFVVSNPSISVTKTKTSPVSGPFKINDNIVYNIAIQNTGVTTLTNLPLKDIYSTSCLQFVSASITPANISGGVITWGHLGDLAPGATVNVTLTMKVVGNCDPANNLARVANATDGFAVADSVTSTIGINIDAAPVAVADTYCIQASTALSVLGNDTDPDVAGFLSVPANAALYNITFPTPPAKGTVVVNGDKTIQFNPLGGTPMTENEQITFVYRVSEIAFPTLFSDATVTLRYSVVNTPPNAVADVANTSTELPVVISVLANDSDPDGTMTLSAITAAPSFGSAVINANGTITYTPFAGFAGTDVFTYRVCDDGCPTPVQCATATVTVNVVFAYYVCKDGSSTISVNAVPGAEGYTWTLPAGAVPASGTLTVLPTINVNWSAVATGTYDICVVPTNYCGPGTQQCVKTVVNKPTLVLVPTAISCFGQNTGAINLTVSGGIAPYTYVWTRTGGGYSASIEDPNNLSPGTYSVTVTDKYSCTATGNAIITQPATAVTVSGVVVNATNPNPTGSITLTVTNGTPGYTYLWSNGATTQNVSGLAGGTYTVTVTDANGCSVVRLYTVNNVGGTLTISSLLATNVLCFGNSTGTIDLEVTGGTGTYTYAWTKTGDGTFTATTQDLSSLSAGTYNVTVSSPGFTNAVGSITVTQPLSVLSATSTFTNVTCNGLNNGSITVSVSGGTAPYTYLWNTGATTQNLTNIGPGTYSVTVTDANGCTTTTGKTIAQPTVISLSGVLTNRSCNPIVGGSITLTVTGGTPNYTYLWSNGATTKDISSLAAGVYAVTVTDANGCVAGKSFEVLQVCVDVTKTIINGPINNQNGTYTLTYQVKVVNTGTVNLLNIQATDNLATTFPSPATFSGLSISSTKFTVNGSYNGSGNTNLLAASQSLIPGEEGLINITLTVTPGAFANPYTNTTTATGYDLNGLLSSKSNTVAVTFTETPVIGIAKELSSIPTINADGSYNLQFTMRVRNFGNVPLQNVQVTDNLLTTFGALSTVNVLSISSANLAVNNAYNGTSILQLLTGTDVLAVDAIKTIILSLKVTPSGAGPFSNTANTAANGSGGTSTTDASQNGILPDPDSDGNPANNNVPTPITFLESPEIGLAKTLVGVPVNNNNGTYTLTYLFTIKNTGNVALKNVQVTDNLTTTFGGNLVTKNSLTSSYFTVNPSYNGTSNFNLLTAVDNLAVDSQRTVLLTVTVTPGTNLGPYQNSATASGSSPFNTAVNDVSHNGIDVDPENDGTSNNSVPTPVSFTEVPKMGLAKAVSTPVNNNNGTYSLSYTIYVKNMGNVSLNNVQVTDILATTFTGATSYSVTAISSTGGLTANSISNFNSTNNLLVSASSGVAYNTTATITLSVLVTPGTKLGTYNNSASGTATGPGGTGVSDVSYNGTNPDPDGDGNPNNNTLPTPLNLTENPAITVTKALLFGPAPSGGNYVLSYRLTVTNTGNVPLDNVQVAEDLVATFPAPASIVSASATSVGFTTSGTFNGTSSVNLLAAAQTLAFGASKTIDVTLTVNTNGVGGPYDNTVYAYGQSPSGNFANNASNTVSVTLFENPAIGLAKKLLSVTDNLNGTKTVTLLLTIKNFGDVTLKDIELYDNIVTQFSTVSPTGFFASNGTLFGSGTWNGTAASNILLSGQTIGVGQSETIEISYIVTPGSICAAINNSASVKGYGPSGATSSTDISTDGLNPDGTNNDNNPNEQVPTAVKIQNCADISVTKTDGSTGFAAGSNVIYTIVVTNNGADTALNVLLTDTAPVNTTISSWSAVGTGVTPPNANGTGNISETIPNMPIGSSITYTVTVNVPSNFSTSLVNTATVSSTSHDSNTANNTATDTDVLSIIISGLVWNDINGTATIDGSELPTNAGNVYANLVNASGVVLASVLVDGTTGSYSFFAQPSVAYQIILTNGSTVLGSTLTTPSLPTGWVNTGVNVSSVANMANKTGIISVTTPAVGNLISQNFGIEQKPSGAIHTATSQINFGGTATVVVPSAAFTGTDPEDGTYTVGLSGRKVRLSPATNGTLYYNGVAVNSATIITSFNPALVTMDPAGNGVVTPTFGYQLYDAANVISDIKIITMPFTCSIGFDFGDLTSLWATPQASVTGIDCDGNGIPDGATGSVWAGNIVDAEPLQKFSSSPNAANGDDNDNLQDEDGLTPPVQALSFGYSYTFNVRLNSNLPGKQVFYGLWFDWNSDGNFNNDNATGTGPAFYSGSGITSSPVNLPVSVKVPSSPGSDPGQVNLSNYKTRLIASDAAVTSGMFNGTFSNGEIEDYQAAAVILPVTFGNVTAEAKNCNVYLSFNYLSQVNNKDFRIEFSGNGTTWQQLAILPNIGNNGSQAYSYVHTTPSAGVNYYRIKQTDIDGRSTYSKISSVVSTCSGGAKIVTYPNPVHSSLTVVLPFNLGKTQLRITDATGKLISSSITQNSYNIINTQQLASGMYLLEVVNAEKIVYTTKFVKN